MRVEHRPSATTHCATINCLSDPRFATVSSDTKTWLKRGIGELGKLDVCIASMLSPGSLPPRRLIADCQTNAWRPEKDRGFCSPLSRHTARGGSRRSVEIAQWLGEVGDDGARVMKFLHHEGRCRATFGRWGLSDRHRFTRTRRSDWSAVSTRSATSLCLHVTLLPSFFTTSTTSISEFFLLPLLIGVLKTVAVGPSV